MACKFWYRWCQLDRQLLNLCNCWEFDTYFYDNDDAAQFYDNFCDDDAAQFYDDDAAEFYDDDAAEFYDDDAAEFYNHHRYHCRRQ